jgi:hypothetical protein
VNPYCAGVLCPSQTNYNFTPNAAPALTAAMTGSDTAMTVGSTAGFPSVGCGLISGHSTSPVDNPEAVCWTGSTSTTFTGLTRGIYGSVGGNHVIGETIIGMPQTTALTINSTPFSIFYNNGLQVYAGFTYQGATPITFADAVQFTNGASVKGNLQAAQIRMYNGVSGIQGVWNATSGQLSAAWINSTYQVAVPSVSLLTTIQSAVTTACTAGSGRVLIPASSAPSDTIGGVTGGCTAVGIEDQRVIPNQFYTWSGSAYVAAPLKTMQTPASSTATVDHSVPIVLNGTTYYLLLSTTP